MSLRQQFVEALHGVERGAWVRFFVAIFGLALAFASALLSTASREAGDALATAVFASSALLLAGVVAVTTVPYLARRVVAHRVRDALNYEVTREGLVYLALTLLMGSPALNTGNNLLFIIIAAMLGAVLVSGIVSAVMISGVEIELHLPHHVFAGQVMRERCCFIIGAGFRYSPFPWCRRLKKKMARSGTAALRVCLSSSAHRAQSNYPVARSFLREDTWAAAIAARPRAERLFSLSSGGYRQSTEVNLRFPRRGLYAQRGIGVSTRFPFSFSRRRARSRSTRGAGVSFRRGHGRMFEVLPMITGEVETNQRGRGSDLYRIRDYEAGDSAR